MRAIVEGFASNNLLDGFITNRVAVPLALNADLEIFDLCDQVYALVV